MSSNIDKYLDAYWEKFGEGYPMYQLGRGRTDDEIIGIIQKCLETGQDVYAMGLIDEDEDVQY